MANKGFFVLSPMETSTHVGIYLSMPPENSGAEVRQILQSTMDNGYEGLESYIEQAITDGKITVN